jgi:hypothetical protein
MCEKIIKFEIMSIFTGLTKEFKVGMLTAVSLTILILGYNFYRFS